MSNLPCDVVQDHILSSMDLKDKFQLASVCREWHEYIVNKDDYRYNHLLFGESSAFTKIHSTSIQCTNLSTFKIFGKYWTQVLYASNGGFFSDYYVYSPEDNTFTKQPSYPYPNTNITEMSDNTVFSMGLGKQPVSVWKNDKRIGEPIFNQDCRMITCKEKLLLGGSGGIFYDVDLETMIVKSYKIGIGAKRGWLWTRPYDIDTALSLDDSLILCTSSDLYGYDLRSGRKIYSSPFPRTNDFSYAYKTKNPYIISILSDRAYTLDLRFPRVQSARNCHAKLYHFNPNYSQNQWRPLNTEIIDRDRYYFNDFYPYRIDLDANETEIEESIYKYPIPKGDYAYNLFWEDGLAFSSTFDNWATMNIDLNVYKLI